MSWVIVTLFGVARKQYEGGIEQKMTQIQRFKAVFTPFVGIFIK